MAKIAAGENDEMDLDDFMSPMSNDILAAFMRTAHSKELSEQQVAKTIVRYFNDIDALLEIPYVRISSVMFIGLAHKAANGQKKPRVQRQMSNLSQVIYLIAMHFLLIKNPLHFSRSFLKIRRNTCG